LVPVTKRITAAIRFKEQRLLQGKINRPLCIGFLADKEYLAPGIAASLKRSGGIQRRVGTNFNSYTDLALLKDLIGIKNK
jgi:hypothetical protein